MKAASVPKGNYIETNTRRSTNATSRGEIDRKERRRESERKSERRERDTRRRASVF